MALKDQMETMTQTVISIVGNIVIISNANQLKGKTIDIYGDLIEPNILTERQIAKKMLVISSGMMPAVGNIPSAPTLDEKTAHLIVYGKLKYKVDGTLSDNEITDPTCVYDPENNPEDFKLTGVTTPMSAKSMMMMWIKDAKSQVKKSFMQIGLKSKAIEIAADHFIGSITIAAATVPGYSLPTAINPGAIKKAFSDVGDAGNNLSAKINDLIDYFDPILQFLPFLLPDTAIIDTILSIVNAILSAINIILTVIAGLMPTILTITSMIPYPDVPSAFSASSIALSAAIDIAKSSIDKAKTLVSAQMTTLTAAAQTTVSSAQAAQSSSQAAAQSFSASQTAAQTYIVILYTTMNQTDAENKVQQYSTQLANISLKAADGITELKNIQVVGRYQFIPDLSDELDYLVVAGINLLQADAQSLSDKISQTGGIVNRIKNAGQKK